MVLRLSNVILTARHAIADAVRNVDELPSWSVFIFVDPILGDPFGSIDGHARVCTRIPVNERLMSESDRPYLIPVDEVGRDVLIEVALQRAIDEWECKPGFQAGARSVCAFIVTTVPAIDLARGLGRSAQILLDGRMRLFRFWDPRVMDLLPSFMQEEGVQEMLIPSIRWCWISRDGRVKSINIEEGMSHGRQSLELNGEVFANFGRINKVLDALPKSSASPSIDCSSIDRFIRKGQKRWRLESDYEVVSYALHCILIGDGFDDDTVVRSHMESAVRNGESPVVGLESLDESFWANLIDRLKQAG